MKTNIKLRVTPEQSEAVQNICFANGVFWYAGNGSEVRYTKAKYLFIDSDRVWFRGITDHNIGTETEGYPEVDANLFIRTNGTCEESKEECQFTKYGFEKPDFECELWQVETSTSFEYVHGLVLNEYDHPMGNLEYHKWNKKTGEVLVGCSSKSLTPIKKPWYETCKFPCLVKDEDGTFLISEIEWYSEKYIATLTPLTNTEIEGLKQ